MRNLTHVSQMALAGVHSLIWWFAPIAQLLVFLTVTPQFGMHGAWENVSTAAAILKKSGQLTHVQLWAAGLVGGFLFASVALARPKYLKWHVALGATFGMVFLAALRALEHTHQYRLSMAFFSSRAWGMGT